MGGRELLGLLVSGGVVMGVIVVSLVGLVLRRGRVSVVWWVGWEG